MKRFLLAAMIGTCLAAPAQAQEQFINVLTGGTSGVYYPLGVALSNIYDENIDDVRTSVQSTKASVENLNLLQAGRGEIAFALGDSVTMGWEGDEEAGFQGELDRLRGIAAIYPNYVQVVARADSGIETLQDLKGKRVSVGAPRSGTELNARAVLGAAGLSYDDMERVEYLPFAESVELMKNRQIDATLQSAGLGVASIRDLAATNEIVVVEIPPDVVEAIGDPVYVSEVIPAGTYDGQEEDVRTAAIVNILVSHEGVSDEIGYQMARQLFENRDDMIAAHSAAENIKLERAAKGMPIPLHPGAKRFYEEEGVLGD